MLPIKLSDSTEEPVTLTEIKEELILSGNADDDYLLRTLKSSRQFIERYAKVSLLTQTWRVSFTPFELVTPIPNGLNDRILLPRSPIQSVQSVAVVDEVGTTTSLTVSTDYRLIGDYLVFVGPEDADAQVNYVVEYTTGYTNTSLIPEEFILAIRLATTAHYENRESYVLPPGFKALIGPMVRRRLG